MSAQWISQVGMFGSNGNELLDCGDFSVSYNADTSQGIFGDLDPGDETALINPSMPRGAGRFLILRGDHRAEYEQLAPQGFEACRAYYERMKSQFRSPWSEDKPLEHEA